MPDVAPRSLFQNRTIIIYIDGEMEEAVPLDDAVALDGQRVGESVGKGVAVVAEGTVVAFGVLGKALDGAEFHHRLVEVAGAVGVDELCAAFCDGAAGGTIRYQR